MELFNYEDFLPIYPDIETPNFQQKILNKKEFYDLRLSKQIESPDSDGLLRHQKLIQRFLSPYTLYDELLVYHSTGTGKTGVAFSVTENLYISKSFVQVIVLAKGEALLTSHRKELIDRYSKRYKPKIPEELDPEQKSRFYKRIVSDFYEFRTFETFAKHIEHLSDEILLNKYSNTIFILDEIHNIAAETSLKEKQRTNVRIYVQFHRLFHLVQNRKILLMSATPMRNDIYELAYIMNLILPLDKQIPIGKEFMTRFVQEDEIINEEILKQFLRGRISILLPAPSNVKVDYKGDFVPPLNVIPFKIFKTVFQNPQLRSYANAYQQDTEKNDSIYSNVRQAALFVFPDGSYGKEGLKNYSTPRGGLLPELTREINTIDKLRKHSCKYAFILETLQQNQNKLVYIYCNMVDGSGANLLAKILTLYNYTRCRGLERLPGKRYILLTSDTPNIEILKEYYNHPRNRYAEYCQVVIGSRRISEGFTFKNVQIVHVTTLFWNYTETQQAIARAIRYMSHQDLLEDGLDPVVEVYQHASMSEHSNYRVGSIDKMMMEYSQRKDVLIRKMDRIIKEISFDCPLTYERNNIDGINGSRECDYDYCDYKCEDSGQEPTRIDWSTYNLYYQSQDEEGIFEQIKNLFQKYFVIKFETIQDIIQVERFQLIQLLSQLIRNNVPLVNAYGIECFLREDYNTYYLVDNVVLPNQKLDLSVYTQYPFITQIKTLGETIQNKVFQHNIQTIRRIQRAENEENVKFLLKTLSLEIQEFFLEMAWIKPSLQLSKWIQNIYHNVIKSTDEYNIVSVLLEHRTRCFLEHEKEWRDCVLEEHKEEVVAIDLEGNPYGYYGIIEDDRFCIKDISEAISEDNSKLDKRKIKTGSNCLEVGFNKPKLAEICIHLGLSVPRNALHPNPRSEFMKTRSGQKVLESWNGWTEEQLAKGWYWYDKTKKDLCDELKNWFAEHNLLVRDKCGKAGKIKK